MAGFSESPPQVTEQAKWLTDDHECVAPQLLKTFGLTNLEIGLVNAIPYGIASVAMIVWGRSSDKTNERRWHTSATLLLIYAGLLLALVTSSLSATVLLTMVLAGACSMKGPFWALVSNWLSSATAATGLAAIGALANLIGGGIMVNAYGAIHDATGSYAIAMLPLTALCAAGGIAVLLMGRHRQQAQAEQPLKAG
jgi:ACS family tartrate transporter-like MFS transporter